MQQRYNSRPHHIFPHIPHVYSVCECYYNKFKDFLFTPSDEGYNVDTPAFVFPIHAPVFPVNVHHLKQD